VSPPIHTVAVAPDSFKGTLSATEAAEAIAAGVRQAAPRARCRLLPMADGGEGTAALLARVTGGHCETADTEDPFGRPLTAELACLGDGVTWAVDTTAASGLTLLGAGERDPLRASSTGTGRLIRAAFERGARQVLLGLGGSATVDGGKGLCEALGYAFLDRRGRPLPPGGGSLATLERIESPPPSARVAVEGGALRLACDVRNPLLGSAGAARVFGPQKGASPAVVARLEAGLTRLADVLRRRPGPCGPAPAPDIATRPGGGAAGGIGATVAALLGAPLDSGGERVFAAAGYAARLDGCELVIVGEGRLDSQSAEGKAPAVVAAHARRRGLPVLAVMGTWGDGVAELTVVQDREAARPPEAGVPSPAEAYSELSAAAARLVGRWLQRE